MTDWNDEMMRALEADGEKLRALTGADHGPWDTDLPEVEERTMADIARAEALAKMLAEEEGVRWDREGMDGFWDRAALVSRAKELLDVNTVELRALARFHARPTPTPPAR